MPTSTSFILALPLKRNDSHFHNDAILSNRTPPNTAEFAAQPPFSLALQIGRTYQAEQVEGAGRGQQQRAR
eukprot:5315727-Pyramimonas_sp.AAC.1